MDIENTEFREALEILGQITWKEIKGFTGSKEEIQVKKSIYSLYKDATNYYKQALKKNPEMQKYLRDRGMKPESITTFNFGYSDSGVALYNYLQEKWYTDDIIEASQIFLDVKRKKDKFIGRIIFPIQNLRGDFVAFAGRITGQWEPKYLNSPASKIYDKSAILYWLYDARSAVTKEDFIIITEWYMDTIALHEAGFINTVAVSGTALTEKHIQIIKRLTHKIYLCFDNDKAGEAATKASLEILKNKGIEVKIVLLKWGKDPDEIIKKGNDFQVLLDKSVSPISFYIQKSNVNRESLDEKKKFLAEILGIIKSYSDEIEKDTYLKEVSQLLDVPTHIVYDAFKKHKVSKQPIENEQKSHYFSQEDILLAYIYSDKDISSFFEENIIFPDALANKTSTCLKNSKEFFANLDMETKEKIKALSFQISQDEVSDKQLETFTQKLNTELYKKQSALLKKEMENGNNNAFIEYNELLKKAKIHGIK